MRELATCTATHLCEGNGKFWESDSESECEYLGDADALALMATPRAGPEKADSKETTQPQLATHRQDGSPSTGGISPPARVAAPPCSTRRTSPPKTGGLTSPPVRAAAPPWKRIWKGPLPLRRTSPTMTIGDYIRPAMAELHHGHREDPHSQRVQNSNRGSHSGPRLDRAGTGRPMRPVQAAQSLRQPKITPTAPQKPKRRLINTSLFLTPPSRSFRDVVMAGDSRGRGRATPARGATDQRHAQGNKITATRASGDGGSGRGGDGGICGDGGRGRGAAAVDTPMVVGADPAEAGATVVAAPPRRAQLVEATPVAMPALGAVAASSSP